MGRGERGGREGAVPWGKRRVRIPNKKAWKPSTNDASPTELSTRRARAIDEQQPSPKQFKNATEKTPGGARATTAYRADAVHTTPSVR